jgi:hypothetical protein
MPPKCSTFLGKGYRVIKFCTSGFKTPASIAVTYYEYREIIYFSFEYDSRNGKKFLEIGVGGGRLFKPSKPNATDENS